MATDASQRPTRSRQAFFGSRRRRAPHLPDFWHRYRLRVPGFRRADHDSASARAATSTLPVHFGRIRSQLIALVGARDSGKTVFMTVFMHEFRYRLGDRLGASIPGADDETRNSFRRDYEQRLYTGHSLPDPTFTVAAERQGYRPPMVFDSSGRIEALSPPHPADAAVVLRHGRRGPDHEGQRRPQRPVSAGGQRDHPRLGSTADGRRPAAGAQRGAAAGSEAGGRSVQRHSADYRDAAGRPS